MTGQRQPRCEWVPLGDGRCLRARVWAGDGTPLVLLHGLLDSACGWDALARATDRPVFALNLPGFGGSDLPQQRRLSSFADDLVEAICALGIREHTLVGHSLGGALASLVAERLPKRTRSLLLLAPAGFGPIPVLEGLATARLRPAVRPVLPFLLVNSVALGVVYAAMVADGHLPSIELLNRTRAHPFASARATEVAFDALREASSGGDRLDRRRLAYDGPVLSLWGERDRLIPASHSERIRRAFPQAGIEVWENRGHHPQREAPERLARVVERACRRWSAGDAARRAPLAEAA